MTYAAQETSEQDGAPIELYEFRRNAKVWRFTSSEVDVTVEANLYTSATLRRSELEISNEKERNNITVTCARNFEIAELFRVSPKTDKISLTLRRYHRADAEIAVIWKGAVLNSKWVGASATLQCEPVTTSLERAGLQRLSQTNCPYVLYGRGCNLDKDDFKTDTTVTAIDGVVVSVAALGAYTSYGGGFIEKEDVDGNFERRFIESFTGLDLTLSSRFETLAVTDAVTVYPGCSHTMAVCDSDFDNILNYGGMPFMPLKNPFGSDPIF